MGLPGDHRPREVQRKDDPSLLLAVIHGPGPQILTPAPHQCPLSRPKVYLRRLRKLLHLKCQVAARWPKMCLVRVLCSLPLQPNSSTLYYGLFDFSSLAPSGK
ncbi:hypothetical protein DsansV1_C23g0176971 [Dioscorea sansibarensis]